MRRTQYQDSVSQTQSMGGHELRLPIRHLFDQSCLLATADGLGTLVAGKPAGRDQVEAALRKAQLTSQDVLVTRHTGKALPKSLSLNFQDLHASANLVEDLADEQGEWRSVYDHAAPLLVDQKVDEIESRLRVFVPELLTRFDFATVIETLLDLLRQWRSDVDTGGTSEWQLQYSENLRRSATTLRRYADEAERQPWWKRRFWPVLDKNVREGLERQHRKDRLAHKLRVDQLRNDLNWQVKQKLIDPNRSNSIVHRVEQLKRQCEKLESLRTSLQEKLKSLPDTVTVTHLVHCTTDFINGDKTFHSLVQGAFEANGCSSLQVAEQMQHGLRFGGRVIGPSELADIDDKQAIGLLTSFSQRFFTKAIPSVLRIDLTDSELQLPLAKRFESVCEKAQPFMRLLRVGQHVHETYVHCHPAVRPLLDTYRPAIVNFSNSSKDEEFYLPQLHVVTVTCTLLGPGHARLEYYKGLYARAKLIGAGKFRSIYRFEQPLARPLAIAKRPVGKQDAIELFDLAVEYERIASSQFREQTVYIVNPLDETVRFCFTRKMVSRRVEDTDYFTRLLEQPWFPDFVRASIPSLPPQWHDDLLRQLDRDRLTNVAKHMEQLGILQARKGRWRFAVPYSSRRPPCPLLYQQVDRTLPGITQRDFIRKLLRVDELYTRVLLDVIEAEAAGMIPRRRLPTFAQHMVDRWSGQGGSLS